MSFSPKILLLSIVLGMSSSFSWAEVNPLEPVKLESPRDTMQTFMSAMNQYRDLVEDHTEQASDAIGRAVRTLNLEEVPAVVRSEKGREVAVFLKEVIDRVIVIDFSKIPDDPKMLRWRLKGTDITIIQIEKGDRAGQFLFSADTVFNAESYFQKVKHLPYKKGSGQGAAYHQPWIKKVIPDWARGKVFFFEKWQWIGLFLSILVGLMIRVLVEHFVRFAGELAAKTRPTFDDRIVLAIDRPVGYIAASLFWLSSVHLLRFSGTALYILTSVTQIVLSLSVIFGVYRLTDVAAGFLKKVAASTDSSLDDQLVPLVHRALKVFVVVFGFLVLFQNLGFNVMSVLAGLGLGGLAFALAAKDTVANLFGSIMIIFDRPFQVGDWINVGGLDGTVEEIGFRSTRMRTFYKSLVSVPNSMVANATVDNYGRRPFRRVKAILGLTYDTSPQKMEAFLEGVKNIVLANPYTVKENFHVVFDSYGSSSLNVLLYCFLKVKTWNEELVERQNLYLEILRLAQKVGVEFAFPTQTLHVDSFPGATVEKNKEEVSDQELLKRAKSFGPNGGEAKPNGLGLFTAPYKETNR